MEWPAHPPLEGGGGVSAQLVVRVLLTSIRSLWSWVRALTEVKEKGNWDLPQ